MRGGKLYRPGQQIPKSGQYEIVGPRGGRTGVERTNVAGKTFGPTRRPGELYILVDPTRH